MRPMTYAPDLRKIHNRLLPCMQGVAFGVFLGLTGALIGQFGDDHRAGIGLLLAAPVVVVVSVLAAIILSRQITASDLLSLDHRGVTLVRRGRTRHWRWADIAAVRVQGGGAMLTVLEGGTPLHVRIEGVYPTPLAEIAARIDDHKAQASVTHGALPGGDAADVGPSAPVTYHVSRKTLRGQRRKEFGLAVATILALPLAVIALMRELHAEVATDAFWVSLAVIVATITGLALTSVHVTNGRSGNLLRVGDEGLTWVRRWSLIRQWRWQDLSSFEVRDASWQGGGARRTIAFVAADDGRLMPGWRLTDFLYPRSPAPALLSFAIDDIYDMPADAIAERLNARRDRALADAPPSRPIEISTAAGQMAMGFQRDLQDAWRLGAVGWALTLATLFWLPIVVLLGWPPGAFVDMSGPAQSASQWLERFLGMLVPIALIAEVLVLARELIPADNALTLDKGGLTLIRGGRRKLWPWRDLSEFKVEARKAFGLFAPRGVIVFRAPGGRDIRSRFLRLCYRLTGRAPAMVIEDIYDTPLDDIAAALNRYRGQGAVSA